MMSCSRASTSSRPQDRRIAFWLISSPRSPRRRRCWPCPARRAPRWPRTPSPRRASRACWRLRRRTSRRWRSASSRPARRASFCVAQGSATSTGTCRGARRRGNSTPLTRAWRSRHAAVEVVLHLHQLGQLVRREARRIDHRAARIGHGDDLRAQRHRLSTAYWATLPEPETLTRRPSNDRPFCLSISRRNRPCRSRWPQGGSASRRRLPGPAGEDAVGAVAELLHHAGHEADLAAAHADVAGRARRCRRQRGGTAR